MRITNHKDFAAGLFFAGFGALTALGALRYDMGSGSAMGPGYFPLMAGIVLLAIGVVVLFGAMSSKGVVERFDAWSMPRVLVVLASLVLFAATIEHLGLVVGLPLLVFVSSLAHPEFSWRIALLLTVILLPMVWFIFVFFLGLPIPLTPRF